MISIARLSPLPALVKTEKIVRLHAVRLGLEIPVPVVRGDDHFDCATGRMNEVAVDPQDDVIDCLWLSVSPARSTDIFDPLMRIVAVGFIDTGHL
jgi:hypothetical protein